MRASLSARPLATGGESIRVRWREHGKQRVQTFTDLASAEVFRRNVERWGPDRAYEIAGVVDTSPGGGETLTDWLKQYVAERTGVQKATTDRYLAYIEHDIAPTIGHLPLAAITDSIIAGWVHGLESAQPRPSGKTIQNKHAFLSGALKAAVRARKIPANPCEGRRLPTSARQEMVFLTKAEFDLILGQIGRELWRDLATWLVATGMRFGEATALRPEDIDEAKGTCRVQRAWKYTGGHRRELGTTKTRRSVRTIDLPPQALDIYRRRRGGEWLFANGRGNAVSPQDFHNQAWREARKVVGPAKVPRVHDLRHTCASWMIQAGVPITVVSRHLGHESITTTVDRYTHIDRTSSSQAAAAIGKMLG